MPNSPKFSYHEILEACAHPGCPVCRVGAQTVRRQLKSLFYEYVNDRDMRAELVNSLGFCSEHVRLLLSTRIADTLGAAIIYEHLLKVVLREFPNQNSPMPRTGKERGQLTSRFISTSASLSACPACQRRDDAFERASREISLFLNDENVHTALENSEGLCMPHLSQVLEQTAKPEDAQFLLTLTRKNLEARQAEMAEVIRKNDYRFRSEVITQEEAAAWRKAMCALTGVSLSPTGDKHD